MTSTGIGKAMRLAAVAAFLAGLLAAPHQAAAHGHIGARICANAFNESSAKEDGFCTVNSARHSPGPTTTATCDISASCTVAVPAPRGEYTAENESTYVIFSGTVDATPRVLDTDDLELCLKPGSTEILTIEERIGGPTGTLTGQFTKNLTNYTMHLRASCESGETEAGTAADEGLWASN